MTGPVLACELRRLPPEWQEAGPRNVQRAAVLVAKRWPRSAFPLTVSFLDTASPRVKERVMKYLTVWSRPDNHVRFRQVWKNGVIRISVDPAAGSFAAYEGTDALLVPAGEPTMWLPGLVHSTPESVYASFVPHEGGHAIGLVHEFQREAIRKRLIIQRVIARFRREYGYTPEEARAELAPRGEEGLIGTPADARSSMCYGFYPDETKDGKAIPGGGLPSPSDYAAVAKAYPR